MNDIALYKLMDSAEEQVRIWDLARLYRLMVRENGKVVDVENTGHNEYKVNICFKMAQDRIALYKTRDLWHYSYVLLKPPANRCQTDPD